VNWCVAGLIGVVVGAALMFLIGRAVVASRVKPDPLPLDAPPQRADPSLTRALAALEAPAIVAGFHDEVLYATDEARVAGLAQGTRIGVIELLDQVRECRRTGEQSEQYLDVRPGPGRPVLHLGVRTAPLDEEGGVIVIGRDRSPLIRVDQARNDFLANVSHELKTPIGAISILAEAVTDAADDAEAVRHFAGRLHSESTRLADLVNQVIALSRLQSDQPQFRVEQTEVAEIVDRAVHRMDELARRREVDLVVRCADGLVVLGDPGQLADAVANLVQNAIVYSGPRARVSVISRPAAVGGQQVAEIAVSDNGIGISEEDQERIFERFYRVDQARSRANGGTGLGLSLVKHIARTHGGSVSVWSKVGQGSTFSLRLPIYQPHDHTMEDLP
jgi:two-component system sensor histidine kinase SenX3